MNKPLALKTAFIFCAGLGISLGIFWLIKGWEESVRYNEFVYKSADHAAAIRTELEHTEKVVSDIQFFVTHAINIEHQHPQQPDIFMPLAEQLIMGDTALLSIGWAVEEKDTSGQAGDVQLNILYAKRGHYNGTIVDDLEAGAVYEDHPDITSLLRNKQNVTAFIHQDDSDDENHDHEMNLIAPVGRQMADGSSAPLGALIVEFSMEALMERAVSKTPVAAQDVRLFVLDTRGNKQLVHTHPSRSRTASEHIIHTGLSDSIAFDFSGQHWRLEFEAAPMFFHRHPIILAWESLALCLLLTCFFTWYVRQSRRQTNIIEQQVINRTEALAKSQSLLNAVLEYSPAVISIKDKAGKYLLINRKFEQLFHCSNAEIIGKTDADIFDVEIAERLHQHDQTIMQSGKAETVDEDIPDERGMRHYSSLKFPLSDQHGYTYAICGIATDVTEQRLAMAEMAKLATVLNQSDELVVITDKNGVIEYVNPTFTRVSGYSADEAIGHTPALVKSNQHGAEFYRDMWKSLHAGKIWRSDFTNRKKNGEFYTVTQSITPILNDQGEVTAFASVQRDVTQSRQLELQIQHTDRVESLGILAGGIAHDFNNLLAAILGNNSLAQRKLVATSPAIPHLAAIEHASNSAADLCRQMLAYSGKGKFVVKAINLSTLVEEMGKLIDVSLANNVVLKYQLSEQLPLINADVAQIQQVVLNLITNASEAIEGKSGVICISTGMMKADDDYLRGCVGDAQLSPGRYVYMEISDTGCGMSKATQRKIFDPFFTTKFTGRGLGMSAMLGIVKGHQGTMRIYSEIGKGTTMKVAFPASDHIAVSSPVSPSGSTSHFSGTALVIDDEENLREVASAMLEDIGFDTLTANNGLEGIEVFNKHKADITLVLMDMTMPKMDGQACFSKLKMIQPNVRVILSSGYSEQDATNRFAGKGLAGFIQKPYTVEALAKKIDEVLRAEQPVVSA